MIEKKLKELINKELDSVVLDKLPDSVLNAPVKKSAKAKVIKVKKRKHIISAVAAIACVMVVAIVSMLVANIFTKQNPKANQTIVETPKTYSCYMVDINPSVMITVDNDDNVVAINAINDDGNLVVMDEDVKKSKKLDECLTAVVDCAMKLGFIDMDSENNAIKISSYCDKKDHVKSNIEKTTKIVEKHLMHKGVYAVVLNNEVPKSYINEKIDGVDIDDEEFLTAITQLDSLTFKNGSISKKIEKYINDYLCSVINDIKTTLDIICKTTDMQLKEQKINYLADKYSIYAYAPLDVAYKAFFSSIELDKSFSVDKLRSYLQDNGMESILDKLLANIPQDEDSFISMMLDKSNKDFNDKLNKNINKYNSNRNKINEKEYKKYVDRIIKEYGSLEAYYELIKNN